MALFYFSSTVYSSSPNVTLMFYVLCSVFILVPQLLLVEKTTLVLVCSCQGKKVMVDYGFPWGTDTSFLGRGLSGFLYLTVVLAWKTASTMSISYGFQCIIFVSYHTNSS